MPGRGLALYKPGQYFVVIFTFRKLLSGPETRPGRSGIPGLNEWLAFILKEEHLPVYICCVQSLACFKW